MDTSIFSELPRYMFDGAIRNVEGLRRGAAASYPVDEDPAGAVEYEVIREFGKVSLRYYRARGQANATPVVLVPPLIKRPFILDLMPGKSVVENLVKQGFDVYMVDWIPPTAEDSWRGFDAYVNRDLHRAVQSVLSHNGADQVSLLGYCFGALLATMYTATHQDFVRNLITLTMPIDTTHMPQPRVKPELVEELLRAHGNVPASFVNIGMSSMAPLYQVFDKYVGMYRARERAGFAKMFHLFELWMNSDVPMAGQVFRELSNDLVQNNRLFKNEFKLGNQMVDLRNIKCPLMNVIGETDDVVPPACSISLLEKVGSDDKENFLFRTGHMGVAVSGGAQSKIWPRVGNWLAERDN